jgi:hypothetical protein
MAGHGKMRLLSMESLVGRGFTLRKCLLIRLVLGLVLGLIAVCMTLLVVVAGLTLQMLLPTRPTLTVLVEHKQQQQPVLKLVVLMM